MQTSLWIAWKFSAETAQRSIQKTTLWQCRSQDLQMCHQKPRTGDFLEWKTNKLQICLDIFMIIFWIFAFSYAENSGIQNTPKSYEVNNSAGLSKVIPSEPWLTGPQKAKSSSDNPGPVDKNNGIYCIYDDSKKMDRIRKTLMKCIQRNEADRLQT